MNIFCLDRDPEQAAIMQCDKHVVKMPLESVQILCTVAHLSGLSGVPYKPTHRNHPCTRWVLEGIENWFWLVRHANFLIQEYGQRYSRLHACHRPLEWVVDHVPDIPDGSTPHALCMPDVYKQVDAVQSYRAYYVGEKTNIATWKRGRNPPSWWPGCVAQR